MAELDIKSLIGQDIYFNCPKRSWCIGVLEKWDDKTGGSAKATKDGGDVVPKLKADDIFPCREESLTEDVNDLLHLTELHDSTLMHCLRRRYMRDVIYTNIGAITVALNPFNFKIPHYMDDQMPKYLSEGEIIEKNLPHSWAAAHNTYWEMVNMRMPQTILVSGESGAGKTEASKIVMKYLSAVSSTRGTKEQKEVGTIIGNNINLASPPLEAFGNAKTVRNDNSSRFGKFMRVKFDDENFLTGAHITKYLLEKSRIVTAAQGERIYHAFYLVLRGKDAKAFELGADKEYRTAKAGNTLNNKEFDSAKEYDDVYGAMLKMGISDSECNSIWKGVAAVLQFENIEFIADGEGSKIDPKTLKYFTSGAKLYGFDAEQAQQELVSTVMKIGNSNVQKLLNPSAASDGRSAFDKAIYDNTFSWLVEKCNDILNKENNNDQWIGLLDIFGFEDFQVNSLEQLCINLTNESLQQHYNTYIFSKDMDECRAEGIDVADVAFPDNGPCLSLIMQKGGVMSMLDEECSMGSGTDMGFLDKIEKKYNGKNPFFEKKRLAKTSFVIKHYAGDVSYEVKDFREKNMDTLKDAWKLLLRSSSDAFLKELLPEPVEVKVKISVTGFFKQQLHDLVTVINSTNPHWIRCIKPHPAKKPLHFDGLTVMSQLSSCGVLGTVKIRKLGFPVRLPKEKIVATYKIIAIAAGEEPTLEGILKACKYTNQEAQIGSSRLFLKSHIFLDIENKKKAALGGSASTVQAYCQSLLAREVLSEAIFASNKSIIDKLRVEAKKVVVIEKEELAARLALGKEAIKGFADLHKQHMQQSEGLRKQMAERIAKMMEKMKDVHEAQRRDVMREELLIRRGIEDEEKGNYMNFWRRCAEHQIEAKERQVKRERFEAENALMLKRRQIRESRMAQASKAMMEGTNARLGPTFKSEDRAIAAVNNRVKKIAGADAEKPDLHAAEVARLTAVQTKMDKRRMEVEERAKKFRQRHQENKERLATMKAAYDRYSRVMQEDFVWQQMEHTLEKGQTVALEENRKLLLREKQRHEAERREEYKRYEEELLEQKRSEFDRVHEVRDKLQREHNNLSKEEELMEFERMLQHREKQKQAERRRQEEQQIAWETDRTEKMLVERPDLTKEDLEKRPLCRRLRPAAPFVMAGNKASYSASNAPFTVLKFRVSPAAGVQQGGPFTVTWLFTKAKAGTVIVITGGMGEVERFNVLAPAGVRRFQAPKEWFSELEIRLENKGQTLESCTLPKASSV